MQFERVSKRLDSSIVLAPGDFISEKKQWVRLLERVEAIFSNVRNEKALFYYLVQDFGDPKESTEGGYFCWDFTVDNEFYFNIDFQKTGFELLFDATNGNYRLKRLFLAWFWKNLISGLQQIISKPRDKVVTNKVAKLLNKTKLFPRVLVLKESEFPCCVFCANELDRNLVETVIPDLQPGRKLDLLDSKLNEKKCSKCGFTYLVFPNLFKYMDKRGLTIILYENKETSDAMQKIFRKKQKNLFQEMKKSGSKPEFAGFSLTTHKTDLFVEAIRQFEEWDKVLSEERIEPILNQDYRHNYKKFYFAYVFGGLPIALKFLRKTIVLHAKLNRLPLRNATFYNAMQCIGEQNLNIQKRESLFMRFLKDLIKGGKIKTRYKKEFSRTYSSALAAFKFGPSANIITI